MQQICHFPDTCSSTTRLSWSMTVTRPKAVNFKNYTKYLVITLYLMLYRIISIRFFYV